MVKEASYKKERDEITNEIRKAKINFETRLADKIKEDSKALYAYVNKNRACREKIGSIHDDSTGNLLHEPRDIVKLLNEYFATVFTKETEIEEFLIKGEEVSIEDAVILNNVEITEDKILKAISNTKKNKTEGTDGLNSTLFIECKLGLVVPLKKLFRTSFDQSILQLDWKSANFSNPFSRKAQRKTMGITGL